MVSHSLIAPPAVPVALREVRKQYTHGQVVVRALDGVSAEFARHSFTAVMGPSGSGKSTLLHCAAGLERPTSGSVWLAGEDLGRLSEKRLTRLRRSRAGFVFQAFNLVPALTVRENVLLPLRLARARWDPGWPDEVIRRVGLADRAGHRPAELSGGQEQRAAVARAWWDYQAAVGAQIAQSTWTIHISVLVLLVYVVIAALNNLAMAALDRRGELAILRLTGATRRQLLRMARIEQAVLLGLALVTGGAIAALTLVPMVKGTTGNAAPYIPAGGWLAVIGGAVLLGMAGAILPIMSELRIPPIEAIGPRE